MSFYINDDNIGHLDHCVMTSESDSCSSARLSLYQSLVQEIAGLHADKRGVGIKDLQQSGKTWVIARSRMEVYHYATWKDEIEVETWPQDPMGLNCPRIVKAKDKNTNKPLFFANTKWAIIDTVKGRPLRPKEVTDILKTPPKELQIDASMPNNLDVIESSKCVLTTYEPVIHYLDTDLNHHVNNLSYINWILDSLPDEFMDSYKPSIIDVRWIRQTYRKDHLVVTVLSKNEDEYSKASPELYFKIERIKEDGTKEDVFDAVTNWKKREEF